MSSTGGRQDGSRRRRWSPRQALAALAVLTSLGGCAGTVRIETLLDDPQQFDGETVRVEGQGTESFGVPVGGGAYRIKDGTGTLTVVSEDGALRSGARVSVEGIFRSVFMLGTESPSALLERERTVR
jgi:hypothetical protein